MEEPGRVSMGDDVTVFLRSDPFNSLPRSLSKLDASLSRPVAPKTSRAKRSLVARQISRQLIDLHHNHRRQRNPNGKSHNDGKHYGQSTRKMPTLKESDKRRQHETEQNRQCDRYKDFTCKIQSRDNDRNDYKIIESQPAETITFLLPSWKTPCASNDSPEKKWLQGAKVPVTWLSFGCI